MIKKLRAKEKFFYGGKTHEVGGHFEASDPDANILVVTGKADHVAESSETAAQPALTQTLEMRDLKSSEESAAQPAEDKAPTTRRRREYLRRDMTSEK